MNCHDFERLWNEQLDARGPSAPEFAPALAAHALACPTCRARSATFPTLAIWGPPPAVPPGFSDRCLAALAAPAAPRRWRRALGAVAMAAAVLLAAGIGLWSRTADSPSDVTAQTAVPSDLADSDTLTGALADATAATWDLARAASEPAARAGRDVLDSTGRAEPAAPPPSTADAADVLQNVTERVHEGARPLSGAARHAFGFLFEPVLGADEGPAPPAEGA